MTTPVDVAVGSEVIAHHLRLFGVANAMAASSNRAARVLVQGEDRGLPGSREATPAVLVLVKPSAGQLRELAVTRVDTAIAPQSVRFLEEDDQPWRVARSLHAVDSYSCERAHQVLAVDSHGRACWLAVQDQGRQVLIVGSDLGGDLVRYRQGDPARAESRNIETLWGIPGERPSYLFDRQQPAGSEHDRQADWWAMSLAVTVARLSGEPLAPLLPGGAPGALVVTGDDDQAYLEKYEQQLELIGDMPITYFLHPLTRHTPATLAAMAAKHQVELGLHPDALEQPGRYAETFREQAAWFRERTGSPALLVRNHGFLNDGYWGHLPVWLEQGVRGSSNLPGVNGNVLNGSLLPARMAWHDELTPHWSILTAIGDGVRFALGADGPESARCITALADRIEQSRIPGVIVLNLHPQNVDETREMHAAVHQVRQRGFMAMTLGECLDWFARRDRVVA